MRLRATLPSANEVGLIVEMLYESHVYLYNVMGVKLVAKVYAYHR